MIKETFKQAVQNVLSNKVRTFLTMLGIIIGVMAVIVIVGLGNGMTHMMQDFYSDMGSDILSVNIMTASTRSVEVNDVYRIINEKPEYYKGLSPIASVGGDTLRRSLDAALSLGVQHISAYHLTVEPDTAFGRRAARGEFRAVDEQISETEFLTVHHTLTEAGFEHYEVSNFALPGFRARHNAAYWHGAKYLGIGPAAHSFDGEERHWNVGSVERYIAGDPAERELLTNRDRFNEYVMTALRTAEGIDTREVAARFGTKRLERMREEAAPYLQSGALRDAGGRLAVPPERFLISDAVIEALFET